MPTVRPGTLTAYRHYVDTYLEPVLGSTRLGNLSARQVRRYLDALQWRGVGARTIRYVHSTLRAAVEDAMREELIEKNMAKPVRAPSVPKAERGRLTVDETRAFPAASRGDRLFALLVVNSLLGLRWSEALGLRWDDVDVEAGVMTVRRGLHTVEGRLVAMEPKPPTVAANHPPAGLVVDALVDLRELQEKERADLGAAWQDSGHVFTTSIGTPLDPDTTTKFVKRALKTAGSGRRMHDLRHGCVSVLLGLGVPPRTVMEIVGHSGLEMTMNIHAHVSTEDK